MLSPVLPVLNLFCQAPFSFEGDIISLSYRKLIIFCVTLICIESCELYRLVSAISLLLKNEGFISQIYCVRYSCLLAWSLGSVISTLAFTPKHLLQSYNYLNRRNIKSRILFSPKKVGAFFLMTILLYIIDAYLYLAFRYSAIIADGPWAQALLYTGISVYIVFSNSAGDMLLNVLLLLNKRFYSSIKEQLQCQTEPKCLRFKIQQIRADFGKACDLKDCIEEAFSLHMFLNIFMAFVESIILYFIAFEGGTLRAIGHKYSYYLAFRGMTVLTKLLITIYLCHGLTVQVKDMAVLVHGLHRNTNDPHTKEELMAFSQEILHRKEPLKALNMINMEFGMLTSMIGSISTHIVILLQFNK